MLNFRGQIISLQATTKTVNKIKVPKYKITIKSDHINYDEISNIDININSTLLNIHPIPFRLIDFGSYENVKLKSLDVEFLDIEDKLYNVKKSYHGVEIKNIIVKIKDNIPTYYIKLLINNQDVKDVGDNIKRDCLIEFIGV